MTMETTLDVTAAQQRVWRGAELLDRVYPEWREHVDVNTLDMTSGVHCVLGQLASTWPGMPDDIREWAQYQDVVEKLEWTEHETYDHGFVSHGFAGYDHLATARLAPLWVSEILRDSNTPTGP